jgi:hypothetical protein
VFNFFLGSDISPSTTFRTPTSKLRPQVTASDHRFESQKGNSINEALLSEWSSKGTQKTLINPEKVLLGFVNGYLQIGSQNIPRRSKLREFRASSVGI